ncbi:MAG: hypothetical protein EOO04_17320 [Chitinophagaceae bacterium]|nr:MAG: hypothetical protein EOO04_17320 [Chitinophagaceae bacterium]
MSDHDFEKRVKQKMDELKFTPSDAVWQAVQMEIRKDRPRRRGWIFIPIALAVLGVAGYFIYSGELSPSRKSDSDLSYQSANSPKSNPEHPDNSNGFDNPPSVNPETTGKNPVSDNPASPDINPLNPARPDPATPDPATPDKNPLSNIPAVSDNASVNNNPSPGSQSSPDHPATSDQHSAQRRPLTRDNAKTTNKSATNDNPEQQRTTRRAGISNSNNKLENTSKNTTSGKEFSGNSSSDRVVSESEVTVSGVLNKDKPAPTDSLSQSDVPLTAKSPAPQKLTDSPAFDSTARVPVVADQQPAGKTDPVPVEKPAPVSGQKNDSAKTELNKLVKSGKKRTGWNWGINVAGGVSNVGDGPLKGVLKSAHMADAAAASPQSSNNFLFTPATAGIPPARPSEVKAGPYFSIGGFINKQLSKRFSFSAGLQYSQYNTIIEVGYRVDSSRLVNNGSQIMNVARYYRADDQSKFSNKYHFVELPLTLHTRITGSKSLPLFWDAGVHVARMIGSDALVFDSGTGVYYKDKSTLNKTQLGFATGFTFGLFGRSKMPVLIGPSVKYNASGMFDKNILSGKHLISAGLDLKILLNKK